MYETEQDALTRQAGEYFRGLLSKAAQWDDDNRPSGDPSDGQLNAEWTEHAKAVAKMVCDAEAKINQQYSDGQCSGFDRLSQEEQAIVCRATIILDGDGVSVEQWDELEIDGYLEPSATQKEIWAAQKRVCRDLAEELSRFPTFDEYARAMGRQKRPNKWEVNE